MTGYADVAELNSTSDFRGFLRLASLFGGIALAAFFGSTLTRNLMQALVTGAATAIVVWMLMGLANPYVGWFGYQFARFWDGFLPWRGDLIFFIGLPTLVAAFVWLGYRNFQRLSETGRLWRRNLLGLAGTVLFIGTATAAVYNRTWESLTLLEPLHGPARIAAGNLPGLSSNCTARSTWCPCSCRTGESGAKSSLIQKIGASTSLTSVTRSASAGNGAVSSREVISWKAQTGRMWRYGPAISSPCALTAHFGLPKRRVPRFVAEQTIRHLKTLTEPW